MRWLPESATRMRPRGSIATPSGPENSPGLTPKRPIARARTSFMGGAVVVLAMAAEGAAAGAAAGDAAARAPKAKASIRNVARATRNACTPRRAKAGSETDDARHARVGHGAGAGRQRPGHARGRVTRRGLALERALAQARAGGDSRGGDRRDEAIDDREPERVLAGLARL